MARTGLLVKWKNGTFADNAIDAFEKKQHSVEIFASRNIGM